MSEEDYFEQMAITTFLHIEQRLFEANQEVMNAEEAYVFHTYRAEAFPHKDKLVKAARNAEVKMRSAKEGLQAIVLMAKFEIRKDFAHIKGEVHVFKLIHNIANEMMMKGEQI